MKVQEINPGPGIVVFLCTAELLFCIIATVILSQIANKFTLSLNLDQE